METVVSYTGGRTMFFSSDEMKWRNRIAKLAKEHPDEVVILKRPEENDGCVYAKLPSYYLKIQPKKAVHYTDEQKLAQAERMRNLLSKTRDKD